MVPAWFLNTGWLERFFIASQSIPIIYILVMNDFLRSIFHLKNKKSFIECNIWQNSQMLAVVHYTSKYTSKFITQVSTQVSTIQSFSLLFSTHEHKRYGCHRKKSIIKPYFYEKYVFVKSQIVVVSILIAYWVYHYPLVNVLCGFLRCMMHVLRADVVR